MTREIRLYEHSAERKLSKTHGIKNREKIRVQSSDSAKRNGGLLEKLSAVASSVYAVYKRAADAKRQFSARFVYVSEMLADKTAREGLFGEDSGKGYKGTDIDYI